MYFLVFLALGTHQSATFTQCVVNNKKKKQIKTHTKGCRSSHWRSLSETKPAHLPTHNRKHTALTSSSSMAVSTHPVSWQQAEKPEVHWRHTIVQASVCCLMFYGWPNSPRFSCSTPERTWECLLTRLSFKCFRDQSSRECRGDCQRV